MGNILYMQKYDYIVVKVWLAWYGFYFPSGSEKVRGDEFCNTIDVRLWSTTNPEQYLNCITFPYLYTRMN